TPGLLGLCRLDVRAIGLRQNAITEQRRALPTVGIDTEQLAIGLWLFQPAQARADRVQHPLGRNPPEVDQLVVAARSYVHGLHVRQADQAQHALAIDQRVRSQVVALG